MTDFYKLLQKVKTFDEAKDMSELIFTKKELEIFELRIEILKMLLAGSSSHRQISAKLKVSISKVTTGSKAKQDASKELLSKFKKIVSS